MSGHTQTQPTIIHSILMSTNGPHNDYAPPLGKEYYRGAPRVSSALFDLGCFNRTTCKICGSHLRLETYTKKRKSPDGLILESTTTTLRCTNRSYHKTLSTFAGTIWADIGNRQPFIFAVDSFLSRGTVLRVANMTGEKEKTNMKYFRVIKKLSTKKSKHPSTRSRSVVLG